MSVQGEQICQEGTGRVLGMVLGYTVLRLPAYSMEGGWLLLTSISKRKKKKKGRETLISNAVRSKRKHPAAPRRASPGSRLFLQLLALPLSCRRLSQGHWSTHGPSAFTLPSPCLPTAEWHGRTLICSSDSTAYASGKWLQLTAWSNGYMEIHSLSGCP